MSRLLTKRDVVWGYASQILNIAAGLLVLPVILRYLSAEEVGLWFVFLTLGSFVQLLEFGFQPTLARNAAYVYAGARQLYAEGFNPTNNAGIVNSDLLADLIAAARKIYLYVASVAALVMFSAGTLYIYSLLPPGYSFHGVLIGWLFFSAGYVINFYYGYYNSLLQGRGDITAANKVIALSRIIMVLLGILLVVFDYGLLGLGVASFISSVGGRMLAFRYFFTEQRRETIYVREHGGKAQILIGELWHNASRLGIVNFGAFLILRANMLIASSIFGLSIASSYGLSLQLLLTISGIASMLSNLQLPRMNILQVSGRREELRGAYGLAMLSSWGIYIFGSVSILIFGAPALDLIGSRTQLLEIAPFICLVLIVLLEMNHSISATYLTTLNYIPFLGAALWSGMAIVIISFSLASLTNLGVWSLIAAQGVVQAVYNNWKWPKEAFTHLDCGLIELLRCGVVEGRRLFFRACK